MKVLNSLAQVREQFEHRLVNHLRIQPARRRVFCRGKPILDDALILLGGHVRRSGSDDLNERRQAAGESGLQVPCEDRFVRVFLLPLGVLRRKLLNAVNGEQELKIQRLLSPERAVVVERGDAFGRRHKLRRAFRGDLRHEVQNGLLRPAIIPRWQRIGVLGDGCRESQHVKERGGADFCFHGFLIGCVRQSPHGGVVADRDHFNSIVTLPILPVNLLSPSL